MKSLIILGSGYEKEKCPFDTEVWVIAKMVTAQKTFPLRRIDRLFSMDNIDDLLTIRKGIFSKDEFVDKINATKAPYISCTTDKEIPLSQEYPLKEVANRFKVAYFANTICYMIALAIYEGYEQIHLWGVSQMGTHEYLTEKACTEFWLGLAAGLGIDVQIHGLSALLKNQCDILYGYRYTPVQLKNQGKL